MRRQEHTSRAQGEARELCGFVLEAGRAGFTQERLFPLFAGRAHGGVETPARGKGQGREGGPGVQRGRDRGQPALGEEPRLGEHCVHTAHLHTHTVLPADTSPRVSRRQGLGRSSFFLNTVHRTGPPTEAALLPVVGGLHSLSEIFTEAYVNQVRCEAGNTVGRKGGGREGEEREREREMVR